MMNNINTGCKALMVCTAINEIDCLHYEPSDNVTINTLPCPCIYHKGNNCLNIVANQKATLENINCLFDTIDETIAAKQTAIDMYNEKREEIEAI